MPGLSLIVGLGNPGRQYEQTRHNAGFWLLDEIARDCACTLRAESRFHGHAVKTSIADRAVWLLKPETFMNLSGKAVAALSRFYKIPVEEILVLHDELDFPAGTVRLKKGGGAGGHNGISDIRDRIGSADFQRLRIGVGRPDSKAQGQSYVLNKPPRAEFDAIMDVLYRTRTHIPDLVAGNFSQVMNELHRDPNAAKNNDRKKQKTDSNGVEVGVGKSDTSKRSDGKGEN